MRIETDRRRIETRPDLPAHERAREHARSRLAADIGLAREFRTIAATNTFIALGCASMEEYGVRLGLTGAEARRLTRLGHALDAPPLTAWENGSGTPATVEEALLRGEISVENASLAGRLLATPGLLRDGENALELAATMPTRRMRDLIRMREEEAAQQEPVSPLSLAVTEKAKENFARARVVASEQAGAMLTEGETLAVVTNHYLDCFDPLRRGEGARRVADTAELPRERYIPSEVRRAVRVRSRDRCEVPGCPNDVFLEFAHIDPHRDGGSREVSNLLRVCRRHHVLLDAGRIRFSDWHDGRPRFRSADGETLSEKPVFLPRQIPENEGYDGMDPGTGQVAERPPPAWGEQRRVHRTAGIGIRHVACGASAKRRVHAGMSRGSVVVTSSSTDLPRL